MLTIEPAGGLCNRLFAIHSGICLAQDTSQPLRVLWKVRSNFGERFDQIFDLPQGVDQILYRQRLARRSSHKILEYLRWGEVLPVVLKDYSWQDIRHLAAKEVDFRALAQGGVHFEALTLFYGSDRPFTQFVPSKPMRELIDDAEPLYRSRIGVHIRRTDHRPAINQSTTKLFEAEISRIIAKAPEQKFFLATDDPNEAHLLALKFPGRIAWREARCYDRSDPRAIQDAVVDLFCLSRTERILGSFASTFSAAAGMLGGILVDYIRSEPQPPVIW